jgi:hypothetical protein
MHDAVLARASQARACPLIMQKVAGGQQRNMPQYPDHTHHPASGEKLPGSISAS